jgi:2-keto-4-pentenoate hydratase/2-oxohepta-3-ene-1,7-dioic acid hydratase in catechol pathway
VKLARFEVKNGEARYGVVEENNIFEVEGDILGTWRRKSLSHTLESVRLLSPIDPPNILAIGLNYKAHVEEGKDRFKALALPLLFIKATSCLNDPGGPIVLPEVAPTHVDYEGELAVVIKKPARNVTPADALDYVLGYTCANDVTARDCQKNDNQWARAKSFDTFAPLGPWIETELKPARCGIRTRLNGRTMQESDTSQLIFDVPTLISHLSSWMTLLAGSVILTGTPAGCGFARTPPVFLKPGDVVEIEIDGIGVLRNPVASSDTYKGSGNG